MPATLRLAGVGPGLPSLGDQLVELGATTRRTLDRAGRRAADRRARPELWLLDRGEIDLEDLLDAARAAWHADWSAGADQARADAVALVPAFSAQRIARARLLLGRAMRVSAIAATTAATLIAVEIAITMAWQEPVSAVLASRAQATLDDEFVDLVADWRKRQEDRLVRHEEGRLNAADALAARAKRFRRGLELHGAVARIEIPGIGASFAVAEGADPEGLALGPAHVSGTPLPGEGGTVAISGHRTTYLAPFRDIDQIGPGDRIELKLPYGTAVYQFERSRVVEPSDPSVLANRGRERLVLTTCHPEYSDAQRFVVIARPVRFTES